MRVALVTLLLVLALAASSCGGSGEALAVRNGIKPGQVRAAAGPPGYVGPVSSKQHGRCWYYGRTPSGKPIAVKICFSHGVVAGIDWSYPI